MLVERKRICVKKRIKNGASVKVKVEKRLHVRKEK